MRRKSRGTPVIVPSFDTGWFRSELRKQGLTQRDLAKRLSLGDPSVVTFLIQGKRRLKPQEAVILSSLFGVTLEEVMKRAGSIEPDSAVACEATVPVVGWVDSAFSVHFGEPSGARSVARIPELGDGVSVVRLQLDGGQCPAFDGALAYFGRQVSPSSLVHRLCLAIVKGRSSSPLLCEVRRGYNVGTYRLITLSGQVREHDVTLESAAPVLAIRF